MSHPMLNDINQKIDCLTKMIIEIQKGDKEYFTLKEAANYLNISKSTLYKHTSSGEIAFNKPNGKIILFKKEDLDIWVNKLRIPANNELSSPIENSICSAKNCSHGKQY